MVSPDRLEAWGTKNAKNEPIVLDERRTQHEELPVAIKYIRGVSKRVLQAPSPVFSASLACVVVYFANSLVRNVNARTNPGRTTERPLSL